MKKVLIGIGMVTCLLLVSCDKNDDNDIIGLEATSLEIISGNNQSGDIESTLEEPIIVLIKDQNGNPYQGADVNFSVTEGSTSQQIVATNNNGEASINWTLGSTEGEQILTVTAFKPDETTQINGSPLIVKAIATESLPNSITYTGENSGTYKITGTAVDTE